MLDAMDQADLEAAAAAMGGVEAGGMMAGGIGGAMGGPVGGLMGGISTDVGPVGGTITGAGPIGAVTGGGLAGTTASPTASASPVAGGMSLAGPTTGPAGPVGPMGGITSAAPSIGSAIGPPSIGAGLSAAPAGMLGGGAVDTVGPIGPIGPAGPAPTPASGMVGPSPLGGLLGAGLSAPAIGGLAGVQSGLKQDFGLGASVPSPMAGGYNPLSSIQATPATSPQIPSATAATGALGYGFPSRVSPSFRAAPDMANAAIIAATGLDPKFANQSYAQMAGIADTAYGLPAGTMTQLINKENPAWDPTLMGPTPRTTIQGLTQMANAARADTGVTQKLDPMQQIFGGAAYLQQMPGASLATRLGHYNAGPGATPNMAYARDVLDNPTTPRSPAGARAPATQIAATPASSSPRMDIANPIPSPMETMAPASRLAGTGTPPSPPGATLRSVVGPDGTLRQEWVGGQSVSSAPASSTAAIAPSPEPVPAYQPPGVANIAGAAQAIKGTALGDLLASPTLHSALTKAPTGLSVYNSFGIDAAPKWASPAMAAAQRAIPGAVLGGISTAVNAPAVAGRGLQQVAENIPAVQPGSVAPGTTGTSIAGVQPRTASPIQTTDVSPNLVQPAPDTGPFASPAGPRPAFSVAGAMPGGRTGGADRIAMANQMPMGLLGGGTRTDMSLLDTRKGDTWGGGGDGKGRGGKGDTGGGGKGGKDKGGGKGRGGDLYGQGKNPFIPIYGGVPGMTDFAYGGLPKSMLENPRAWGLDPAFAREMLKQRKA